MSDNIGTLREQLFETMRELRSGKIDVEKAKAISELGQTIINSAKVEVDYAKVTGSKGSGFLEKQAELPPGISGTTVHKIR